MGTIKVLYAFRRSLKECVKHLIFLGGNNLKQTIHFYRYISMSILGMLGAAVTILTDTFFVSDKLGVNGLAALNLTICIFGLINGLGMLLGIGGATYYSISKARGEDGKANCIFTTACYLSLGIGILLCLIGVFFSKPIVLLLGAQGDILPMADVYMKTILCFAPFFILRHLYISFIRNDGNPKLAMFAMLVGSAANVILDYVFMYPLNLGIFGAAFATALTPVVGVLICSAHWLYKRNQFHFTKKLICVAEIKKLCGFGVASFINEFSSGIVLLVFNLLILKSSGNVGVAAYGIVANLALIVLAVFTGVSQGVQPLLSTAYGEGKSSQVQFIYHRGIIVSTIMGVLVLLGTLRFAPEMIQIFNQERHAELQVIAERGIKIYFISFLFLGYNFMTTALFSATEYVSYSLKLSFFRGCIGIISIVVLFSWFWGLYGIWLSIPTVEIITLVMGKHFSKVSGYSLKNNPIQQTSSALCEEV